MQQNDFIEEKVQKYEDSHFLNFLESEKHYLRFNRLKLETFQHQRGPSPWVDTQNCNIHKPPKIRQKLSIFRIQAQNFQLKNPRVQTQLRKKKQFQESSTNFKLNNTFVQFGVKFKSKSNKQDRMSLCKARSNSIRNGFSKQRIDITRRENEQQFVSKTPKIKFLERKFRIREGTSNHQRFRLPKTERMSNDTKNLMTEQVQKSETFLVQNQKALQDKTLSSRPIHSRQVRLKWFE